MYIFSLYILPIGFKWCSHHHTMSTLSPDIDNYCISPLAIPCSFLGKLVQDKLFHLFHSILIDDSWTLFISIKWRSVSDEIPFFPHVFVTLRQTFSPRDRSAEDSAESFLVIWGLKVLQYSSFSKTWKNPHAWVKWVKIFSFINMKI